MTGEPDVTGKAQGLDSDATDAGDEGTAGDPPGGKAADPAAADAGGGHAGGAAATTGTRHPAHGPAARTRAGADTRQDGVDGGVQIQDITIPASDGLPLAATLFHPGRPARAWCSIASANGVERRFYRRFASFLAQQGIAAVTFDYRGIGGSPTAWEGGGAATGPPRMQDFGRKDLEGVLEWIHGRHPRRQFHVGHSGGGQFLGLAPGSRHVEAAVAVASQSGYWRHWHGHRARMWLLWHVLVPASTHLRGHFPAPWFAMGEPLPKTVALQWARWCRHPDFIVDDEGRPVREHFRTWRGRMRAIVPTDDARFAPRAAAEALMGFYESARTEVVDLAPEDLGVEAIGHFGFFRKGCEGAWTDVIAWLLRDDPG